MLLPLAVLPLGLGGVSSVALPVLFAVFLLAGAVQSGLVVGYMNALIRISPNERRPLYVGLMNTLLGPMILGLALSGGVIVEFASYEVMFIISSAAALLSLISARRLKSLNGQPAPATAIDRP
jgi:MFS family permease